LDPTAVICRVENKRVSKAQGKAGRQALLWKEIDGGCFVISLI